LNKGNNNVNMPLPKNLRPAALKKIKGYNVINGRLIPYHNAVHNAVGGQMPIRILHRPTRFSGPSIRSWFRFTSGGATVSKQGLREVRPGFFIPAGEERMRFLVAGWKERFSGVITIWSSRASQLMAQSKKGSSCVHLVLQLCERQFGLGA